MPAPQEPLRLSAEQIQAIAKTLSTVRGERGIAVQQIANQCALTPTHIKAIEMGDVKPFYNHGFFLQAARRCADALQISLPERDTKMIAKIRDEAPPAPDAGRPAQEPDVISETPNEKLPSKKGRFIAVVLLVIAVIIALRIQSEFQTSAPPATTLGGPEPGRPAATTPAATPVTTAPAASPSSMSGVPAPAAPPTKSGTDGGVPAGPARP